MIYISKLITPVSTGISAGDLEVGATVQINENGGPVDYIVVQQGLPGSMYDASCDGTWLLRKDIAENRQWNPSNSNDYLNSAINTYLNGDWLTRYDSDVSSQIVQCKIPCLISGGAVKAFLLSAPELSFNIGNMPSNEGSELSYFLGCADSSADTKRLANYDNLPARWWTRSPNSGTVGPVWSVYSDGGYSGLYVQNSIGLRPCIILPFTFKFKEAS